MLPSRSASLSSGAAVQDAFAGANGVWRSRLPEAGPTIFSTMSQLAQETGAINLGQGFPDFASDPRLHAAVSAAMHAEQNQYAPAAGLPALRRAIRVKTGELHNADYDADHEITVTNGASQAIFTAILATVHPGDEVILIEPAYDCYLPAIRLAGADAVGIPMLAPPAGESELGFRIDWPAVGAAVTARTRMIIVNSPHNPTSHVMQDADLDQLEQIVARTQIIVLSDEVYEHMIYDGRPHCSVSQRAMLAERAFVVSSFGKTFHVTGWKVGYVLAPPSLMREFRKVHQYNVFCVNTPMQAGIAAYLADPAPWRELSAFYQYKRDRFRQGLANTGLRLLPCAGTYFQTVDYSALSALPEVAFAEWLTCEIGVAGIPLAVFHRTPVNSGLIRFCFAKENATIDQAIERLQKL